jgi:hypothetical protein
MIAVLSAIAEVRRRRASARQPEGDRAGLVGTLDDHGFPARTSIGAGATDDRRDLAGWRGVEELRRDLTPWEQKRDVTGRLRRCEAREDAHAGVVANLPAFAPSSESAKIRSSPRLGPCSPRSTSTSWNATLNWSVRGELPLALERDAATAVSRTMVTAAATAIIGGLFSWSLPSGEVWRHARGATLPADRFQGGPELRQSTTAATYPPGAGRARPF